MTPPSFVPLQDPVLNAIKKYDNHPSEVLIRNNVTNNESFEFHLSALMMFGMKLDS